MLCPGYGAVVVGILGTLSALYLAGPRPDDAQGSLAERTLTASESASI